MKQLGAALGAGLMMVGLIVLAAFAAIAVFLIDDLETSGGVDLELCEPGEGITVNPSSLPSVPGFTAEQLKNASHILAAGAEAPRRAQDIAVMTALGESGLNILDHGDDVGPDSRGLFQQRDNGAWGNYEDRMDPVVSSQMFYQALLAVPGWQSLEPTIAAHRTQRNANPWHYERYWHDARQITEAFTSLNRDGQDVINVSAAVIDKSGRAPCATELTFGGVGPQGWANPTTGRLTSPFGFRVHPISGILHLHTGSDVANVCGTPVHAAADGVVIWQGGGGYQGRTGNQIVIDHGGGVITRYGHLLTGTMLVRATEEIDAGQQIASIGGDPAIDPLGAGSSTGCHLHFEVNINGTPVDARAHLASHGVEFGS